MWNAGERFSRSYFKHYNIETLKTNKNEKRNF